MRMMMATLMLGATIAIAGPLAAQERTITVNGRGEVAVEPDMATIVLAVQSEADASAQALDEASAATAAILARLDVEGIDPLDIRSGAIRLSPRYSQSVLSSGQQIIGYRAVNSVEVDVNDLDRLGSLLAALVGDGANRLDRVTFGLQDPTAATDDARRRAVADAIRLAGLYAQAADVSLGQVITITEGGGSGYRALEAAPVVMESLSATSAPQFDVPVAPGQIELNAAITMVFGIAEDS